MLDNYTFGRCTVVVTLEDGTVLNGVVFSAQYSQESHTFPPSGMFQDRFMSPRQMTLTMDVQEMEMTVPAGTRPSEYLLEKPDRVIRFKEKACHA